MPGRSYTSPTSYRYGFNGKENDDEVKGIKGSQQDYGMRIYDPRLGKFLSMDPLTKSYPELTPYQFAGNTPIQAIDIDGEEPDCVVDKNGRLTEPVIFIFNAILGYEDAQMRAVIITKDADAGNNAETYSPTGIRTNPSGETDHQRKGELLFQYNCNQYFTKNYFL